MGSKKAASAPKSDQAESVDKASAGAHAAVDRVGAVASHSAEALDARGEQVIAAKDQVLTTTRRYFQQYPVAAIGVAAATGYLLSRVLSKR